MLTVKQIIKVSRFMEQTSHPPVPTEDFEQKYCTLVENIKRSRMKHGDCASGKRYNGQPLACTACMANIAIEKAVSEYKGVRIVLAEAEQSKLEINITPKEINQVDKIWVGRCVACKSVAEYNESELTHIQEGDAREPDDFSWEKCPKCGEGDEDTGYNGMLFYRKKCKS